LDTTIDEKAIRADISAQIDEKHAADLVASQKLPENIPAHGKDAAELINKLQTEDLIGHYGSSELDTTIDEKAIRSDISAQIDEEHAADLAASQKLPENIPASKKDVAELVEEAKQRLQHEKASAIVEKYFQSDVDRLGAHDTYDWLQERSRDYTLSDDEYDKVQELLGRFKAGVKAGKLPDTLMREINREMTAHGI
jgi:hypothetical protein